MWGARTGATGWPSPISRRRSSDERAYPDSTGRLEHRRWSRSVALDRMNVSADHLPRPRPAELLEEEAQLGLLVHEDRLATGQVPERALVGAKRLLARLVEELG